MHPAPRRRRSLGRLAVEVGGLVNNEVQPMATKPGATPAQIVIRDDGFCEIHVNAGATVILGWDGQGLTLEDAEALLDLMYEWDGLRLKRWLAVLN